MSFLIKSALVIALVYFLLHKGEFIAPPSQRLSGEPAARGAHGAGGAGENVMTALQRSAAAKLEGAARGRCLEILGIVFQCSRRSETNLPSTAPSRVDSSTTRANWRLERDIAETKSRPKLSGLKSTKRICIIFKQLFGFRSMDRISVFRALACWGVSQEAALSDDFQTPADPAAHATTAPTVDVGELREQIKAVTAERDRHLFEKSEIVEKANAISRDRDELRQHLAAATTERDRLASEASSASRAAESADEIARLRRAVESSPSADPAELLWTLAAQKTKEGVAFLRSRFPKILRRCRGSTKRSKSSRGWAASR